jgi:hypothetical protein
MQVPRISLAGSIAGIVIVAIGLAVLHEDLTNGTVWRHGHFLVVGVLPMACLLIWAMLVSVLGRNRRGAISPFLIGFELAGWGALFLMVLHDAATDDSEWGPIGLASPILQRLFPRDVIDYHEYEIVLTHALLFLTPSLIAALLGGWLASRSGPRLGSGEGSDIGPRSRA